MMAERISKKALIETHSHYHLRRNCVGFVLTERCPVGCRHCINSSTMKNSRLPDLHQQIKWIADISRSGVCNTISITGGEPFSSFEELVTLVSAIRDQGISPNVVTSGFWAIDDNTTRIKLDILKDAGLTGLAISIDEFHQENVPLENVARVLLESKNRGIALKITFTYMENRDNPNQKIRALRKELGSEMLRNVKIRKSPIIKAGRARNLFSENPPLAQSKRSHLLCPAIGLLVKQNGDVASCCGAELSPKNPFIIGNMNSESFNTIYKRFIQHPLTPFVETWGLADILDRLLDAGLATDLIHYKAAEEGLTCELCQSIFSNPIYADFFIQQYQDPIVMRQIGILKLILYGDVSLLRSLD